MGIFAGCFNPCFNGSYSSGVFPGKHSKALGMGFNPCFNGSYSSGPEEKLTPLSPPCFNPCFNGSYSSGVSGQVDLAMGRIVSILVLMEVILQDLMREVSEELGGLFQSLF